MHCTIRHYPSQALSLLINRNPPRCFSYKNCFITSAVSKIKGEKKQSTEQLFSGLYEDLPYLLWRAMEATWGQSQYPMLLVCSFFLGL